MKVYFAGPDVFRQDYGAVAGEIRALCAARGIIPLLPGAGGLTDPKAICEENLNLILGSDAVIANMDPFRGPIEPDSGTVFEAGFAHAAGKPLIIRLSDRRPYRDRLAGALHVREDGSLAAADGALVEDFGLPLNLMLACSADLIVSTLEEATDAASRLASGRPPESAGSKGADRRPSLSRKSLGR